VRSEKLIRPRRSRTEQQDHAEPCCIRAGKRRLKEGENRLLSIGFGEDQKEKKKITARTAAGALGDEDDRSAKKKKGEVR